MKTILHSKTLQLRTLSVELAALFAESLLPSTPLECGVGVLSPTPPRNEAGCSTLEYFSTYKADQQFAFPIYLCMSSGMTSCWLRRQAEVWVFGIDTRQGSLLPSRSTVEVVTGALLEKSPTKHCAILSIFSLYLSIFSDQTTEGFLPRYKL